MVVCPVHSLCHLPWFGSCWVSIQLLMGIWVVPPPSRRTSAASFIIICIFNRKRHVANGLGLHEKKKKIQISTYMLGTTWDQGCPEGSSSWCSWVVPLVDAALGRPMGHQDQRFCEEKTHPESVGAPSVAQEHSGSISY